MMHKHLGEDHVNMFVFSFSLACISSKLLILWWRPESTFHRQKIR